MFYTFLTPTDPGDAPGGGPGQPTTQANGAHAPLARAAGSPVSAPPQIDRPARVRPPLAEQLICTAVLTVPTVGTGVALTLWWVDGISWVSVALFWIMYAVTGSFGICIGYHRLGTHGSFKTYPIVR